MKAKPTIPDPASSSYRIFQQMMVAEDTGGAIRGPVRGDVFFGWGKDAEFLAGYMKNKGDYTLLLPESIAEHYKE